MTPTALIGTVAATLIDGEALFDTAVASLAAGVFVALTGSLAIYGFATAAEMQRVGRDVAAVGAGALAVVASLAFMGALGVGLYLIISG